MGLFSWNCRGCAHPALNDRATDKEINAWMSDVVVMFEDGSRAFGSYDGYGRAGIWDQSDGQDEPCLWHQACWEIAGKPDYDRPSDGAADQGWFFDDGDHDMLDPRLTHEPGALERAQAVRAGRKKGLAFRRADEDADEGTYQAIWQMIIDRARRMTLPEREAAFGYDPLKYEDA